MKFGYVKVKSKCAGCKGTFDVGTLKVVTPNILGSSSTYKAGSYHFSCYKQENVTPPSIEDINGVMKRFEIEEKDKELLENFILACQNTYSKTYSKKRKFDTIKVVTQDKGTKKTKDEIVLGLPFEIWNLILSYVSGDVMLVYRLNFVNKDFYALAQQDSLWEIACKNHANKTWSIKKHLEKTINYLQIVIRNEGMQMEPNWKMIFIELFSKLCFNCHKLREGKVSNALDGKMICNRCRRSSSYHFLPKTRVKEQFKIPPKELEKIKSEKEPTTRQGAKYKETYLAMECQRYLESKRLESLKEKITLKDIMKLEPENPKRLYVETLIPSYSQNMKSVDGFYGCKKCGKELFKSSQRIEPQYIGSLTFESASSSRRESIRCCLGTYISQNKDVHEEEDLDSEETKFFIYDESEPKQKRIIFNVGKWDLMFVSNKK